MSYPRLQGFASMLTLMVCSASLLLGSFGCQIFGGGGDSSESSDKTGAATQPSTRPDITHLIELSPGALVVHLDVYQLNVPRGTISRNDAFWKHVEEQRVDPATYDLLLRNGVRVGIAPDDDWDYFKDILERNNARATKGSVMSGETGSLELPMKQNIATQDIFYFNDDNKPVGRTFDKCENLLGVSFWPDPRRADSLHVTVSPIVRATRSRLEFRLNGEEREIVEVRPEHLYDLNLRAEIPPKCFLVLAPSPEAKWPMSLGNAFLINSGEIEQKETILVLAPKMILRNKDKAK